MAGQQKIDVRWPDDLVARIDDRAAATGSNRSEVVRKLVEEGLARPAEVTPALDLG